MPMLNLVWRLSVRFVRLGVWAVVTAWLGARAMHRWLRLIVRSQQLFAEVLPCPRGHGVAVYGIYVCSRCGATSEMYAFSRCGICGTAAGWIPCPRCNLAVRNPAA